MRLLSLLLAPSLALAGSFSGTVTLLDGTPVAGAVVASLTDSVTTAASGAFALARTTGIAARSARTVPVTSHLSLENGRPRLSFAGTDIAGRSRNAAVSRQNLPGTAASAAARSTGTPDTLKVYWKGKRLTVLPVGSDTSVAFRIDTAWKDDAGIPWNPRIAYGSLFDARDGQTYRTVNLGAQTWMAENLSYAEGSSHGGMDSVAHMHRYGRLYTWPAVMNGERSSNAVPSGVRGICPVAWHVPSDSEWYAFMNHVFITKIPTGIQLKSTSGWSDSGNGYDSYGYRLLPAGVREDSIPESVGKTAKWWSSTENAKDSGCAWNRWQPDFSAILQVSSMPQRIGYSLRCLKD